MATHTAVVKEAAVVSVAVVEVVPAVRAEDDGVWAAAAQVVEDEASVFQAEVTKAEMVAEAAEMAPPMRTAAAASVLS